MLFLVLKKATRRSQLNSAHLPTYIHLIIVTLCSIRRTTRFPVITMPVTAEILHHTAQAQLQWHNCHHTTAYKENLYTAPTLLYQFHKQIPVTVIAYLPSIYCHT